MKKDKGKAEAQQSQGGAGEVAGASGGWAPSADSRSAGKGPSQRNHQGAQPNKEDPEWAR